MTNITNRAMKALLIKMYGRKCMFIASNCEALSGYVEYYKKQKSIYSKKKIKSMVKTLTVHHFVHRSEDGQTSEENCCLVNELAHAYIHSLPKEDEEHINNKIRDYKKSLRCHVVFTDETYTLPIQYTSFSPVTLEKDYNPYIDIDADATDTKKKSERRKRKTRKDKNNSFSKEISKYLDR